MQQLASEVLRAHIARHAGLQNIHCLSVPTTAICALLQVFGDGSWRYPQTAPAPFKGSKHKAGHQGEQSRSVVAALPAVAAAQSAAHHRPQTRSLTAAAAAASAAAAADTPNRRSKGKQRQLKIKMPSVTHKRAPTSLRRSAGQGRGVVKQRSRQPKQRGSA